MKPGLSLPICIVIHHDKLNTSGTEMVEVKIMKCFRPLHDLFISWTVPVFNIKYQHFNSFVVVSNLLLPWTNNSFRNITANNIRQYFLQMFWNIFWKYYEIFSANVLKYFQYPSTAFIVTGWDDAGDGWSGRDLKMTKTCLVQQPTPVCPQLSCCQSATL